MSACFLSVGIGDMTTDASLQATSVGFFVDFFFHGFVVCGCGSFGGVFCLFVCIFPFTGPF